MVHHGLAENACYDRKEPQMSELTGPASSVVGPVMFESEHRAMAPVTTSEIRSAHGRRYRPESIEVVYKRSTDRPWDAGWISLYGRQLRKDGSTGTREVREVLWTRYGAGPDWARAFYHDNVPD